MQLNLFKTGGIPLIAADRCEDFASQYNRSAGPRAGGEESGRVNEATPFRDSVAPRTDITAASPEEL